MEKLCRQILVNSWKDFQREFACYLAKINCLDFKSMKCFDFNLISSSFNQDLTLIKHKDVVGSCAFRICEYEDLLTAQLVLSKCLEMRSRKANQ